MYKRRADQCFAVKSKDTRLTRPHEIHTQTWNPFSGDNLGRASTSTNPPAGILMMVPSTQTRLDGRSSFCMGRVCQFNGGYSMSRWGTFGVHLQPPTL